MHDETSAQTLLADAAQQAGLAHPEGAAALLAAVLHRLQAEANDSAAIDPFTPFYIYRVERPAGAGSDAEPSEAPPARPRTIVAFRSADAAYVFAQRAGLGTRPRVLATHITHLLVTLIRQASIQALLFSLDETLENWQGRGLPPGVQVERSETLAFMGAQGSR